MASEGLSIDYITLDVNDTRQIKKTAEIISTIYGRLDVLINNAAVLLKQDKSIINVDDNVLKSTIQTNALSIIALVGVLAPLMIAGSRIINVSSNGGSMTDPVGGWAPIYCVSKSMLNAITRQQAAALSHLKISVNAMCPGWVQTDMGGAEAPRNVSKGAETAVWLATTNNISTGKFFRDKQVIEW